MKILVLVAALALTGCQSYFDDQQSMVDARNNARDDAWCADLGIDRSDTRYAECRVVARDFRLKGDQVNVQRAAALLGAGTSIYGDSQPINVQVTQ